jgi:hypothetical protein
MVLGNMRHLGVHNLIAFCLNPGVGNFEIDVSFQQVAKVKCEPRRVP